MTDHGRRLARPGATPDMIKVVGYCRVSTKKQTENLSLGTQEKQIREFCRRKGWVVVRVFTDGGRKGGSLKREQLDELIAFCRKRRPPIDYAVVYDVSRFARGNEIHWKLRAGLKAVNVNLRSVTQDIDETPTGVMNEGFFTTHAAYENAVRKQKVTLGMQARLEAKGWPFQAALGYRKVRRAGVGPTLEQDPERAPLLRQAFQLVASGLYHPSEVLRKVTAAGLRTRANHALTSQSFSEILRKPVYAGWFVVQKWDIRERGDFDSIVDDATFDRVQQVLSGRPAPGKRRLVINPLFPLRGFVKCQCGVGLAGARAKGRSVYYPYYRCQKCRGVNIKKADLEGQFETLLEGLQARTDLMPLALEVVRSVWVNKTEDRKKAAAKLKVELRDLAAREASLLGYLLDGTIDRPTYQADKGRIFEATAALHRELADEGEGIDPEPVLAFAGRLLAKARPLWKSGTAAQQVLIQKVLFPGGIVLTDGNLKGTATAPLFFSYLGGGSTEKQGMVAQIFTSWNQMAVWMRRLEDLNKSA